jgi:hypothetical protein
LEAHVIQTPVLPLSRLRTSPDGHFLVSESGPFFWMGDTAWELIHRATREEIDHYLANRQQKDFNVVQTVAIAELDGPTQPNAYGECPLIGGDPLAPNLRYFEHVDYVIDQAARYGLYVALLPTWAEWVTPRFHAPLFTTPKQGYAYGHFLGQRYGQRTNVIWILGGDRLPDEAPHGIARHSKRAASRSFAPTGPAPIPSL